MKPSWAKSNNNGSRFRVRAPAQWADSRLPAQNGRGDVLQEIRRLLRWSRENIGARGAAIGYFSYDFARTLEPRAFAKNSPPRDLKIPDVRLVFFEERTLTPRPPLPRGGRGGDENINSINIANSK